MHLLIFKVIFIHCGMTRLHPGNKQKKAHTLWYNQVTLLYKVMGPHLKSSPSVPSFGAADIIIVIFKVRTSFNLNETWHIHCGMNRLHRGNNGLLAQELVCGAADIEILISHCFRVKSRYCYI